MWWLPTARPHGTYISTPPHVPLPLDDDVPAVGDVRHQDAAMLNPTD